MKFTPFEYDPTYSPAAPVVEIEIDGYNARRGKSRLRALIDSGADATMIPIDTLLRIGAGYKETLWMRGVTGERIEVDLYLVAIRISTNLVRGLHVVGVPATGEAIVGRDVLNQLVVTLDGPAEVVQVQDE